MALFEELARRAEARALATARTALDEAEAAYVRLPGTKLQRAGDRVIVEGKGLTRRWLNDASLRFLSWSMR